MNPEEHTRLRLLTTSVLRLLGMLGLLRPSYRAYEWLKALRSWAKSPLADNGLPSPPPQMIVLIAGAPDVKWFLESGRLAMQSILDILSRNGHRMQEFRSILDFGCGCGRVTRYWSGVSAAVVGSDCNERLVEWCRRNLSFARFEVNGLAPPLTFGNEEFDFVYALSVLTHLPEELQLAWMDEFRRVLAPGGLLLLTTNGERYLWRLTRAEKARFRAGECVVRWQDAAGTNLCGAFHPVSYVQTRLARGFEVLDFVPEGAKGNPYQDVFLLGKRTGSSAP